MDGFIYKFTNLINNKIYIGRTIDVKKRLDDHIYAKDNYYFHRALKKYGINNFKHEVIHKCSLSELNTLEKYYINYYQSFDKNGYNQTIGGQGTQGYKLTEEQKRYVSITTKEAMNKPEIRNKISKRVKEAIYKPEIRNKFLINNRLARTPEANKNNSKAQRGEWLVTNIKTKEQLIITNLKEFCKINNLTYYCMKFVNQGKYKQHKGFSCRLIKRYNKNV